MSAIAGIVHLDGSQPDCDDVARMLAAMPERCRDGLNFAEAPGGCFGFGLVATVPEARRDECPCGDSIVVVGDARVDNRPEMLAKLDLPPDCPDGAIIHAATRRWGADAPRHVIGDYAWVAWRPERRRLLLVRDFLGMRPLFYTVDGNRVAFASTLAGLLALPWVDREVDPMRVLEWRTGQYGDRTNSFLKAVKRPPAACAVSLDAGGAKASRYWFPEHIPVDRGMSMEQASEGVRAHFEEAVASRLRSNQPVAAQLSGGLDSSSVVAMARSLQPDTPLHAYTMTFKVERHADEAPYARQAAEASGATLHEIPCDGYGPWWRLEDRTRWAGGPLVSLHSSFLMGTMQKAKQMGHAVVLDGSEGDATIGHGEFLLVNHLRRLRLRTAYNYLHSFRELHGGTPWRRFLVFGVTPMFQAPWTTVALHRGARGRGALGREISARGPVGPALVPVLLDHMRSHRVWQMTNVRSDEAFHRIRMRNPLLDEFGMFTDQSYAGLGVEHRSPFFDRRLVDFCLTVPSTLRTDGPNTRVYFRHAMADLLPPGVAWRRTKTRFDFAFREYVADMPPTVDQEELQSWQWNPLPGLFPPHTASHPIALLRKQNLRLALAQVAPGD